MSSPPLARDGSVDWQPWIQSEIDRLLDGMYASPALVARIDLPTGILRLDRPLVIARKDGTGAYLFVTIELHGASDGRGIPATQLVASFADREAIAIHAGRGVVISNLQIQGRNKWADVPHDGNIVFDEWQDQTLCVLPGVDDARTRPYAAIAIDPYVDPVRQTGSSGIIVRSVLINGFGVGVANGCHDGPAVQGEGVCLEHVAIHQTRSAIAIGGTQARGIVLYDLSIWACDTFVDCVRYGYGMGCTPSIVGAVIAGCRYLFDTFSNGSAISWQGIYAENVQSIGRIGGGGMRDCVTWSGGAMSFTTTQPGTPAPLRLTNSADLTLQGVTMRAIDSAESEPFWCMNVGGYVRLQGCRIGWTAHPPIGESPAMYWLGNAERVSYDRTIMCYGDIGEALLSPMVEVNTWTSLLRAVAIPGVAFVARFDALDCTPRFSRTGYRHITLGTIAIRSSAGTATFTTPFLGVLRPGDVIMCLLPTGGTTAGRIKSIVGAEVTCEYTPAGIPDGLHYLYVERTPRVHIPTTCDVVAGPSGLFDRLINVHSPPGYPAISASWKVGDRVMLRSGSTLWLSWPKFGAHITAIDPSSGAITLSAGALGAALDVHMFDAEMATYAAAVL